MAYVLKDTKNNTATDNNRKLPVILFADGVWSTWTSWTSQMQNGSFCRAARYDLFDETRTRNCSQAGDGGQQVCSPGGPGSSEVLTADEKCAGRIFRKSFAKLQRLLDNFYQLKFEHSH